MATDSASVLALGGDSSREELGCTYCTQSNAIQHAWRVAGLADGEPNDRIRPSEMHRMAAQPGGATNVVE